MPHAAARCQRTPVASDAAGLERARIVEVIRFTIVAKQGITSFVGPCHAIKMLVAACGRQPRTIGELLEAARPYDDHFVTGVRSGLAVFDEHNTPENLAEFRVTVATTAPNKLPPFRVLDEATRRASLEPAGTGLILINLDARRIIQVQNSYADIQRSDRGRIRQNGKPTHALYHYRLPDEWAIIP